MKKTLGQEFAELRAKSRLTMLEVANLCDISEAVVWKLESDRPVRWESAHLILSVLKIGPKSPAYQQMHALWLKGRQERAESQPVDFGEPKLSKYAVEATRKFRQLVRDLSPEDMKKVLAGAQRAAARL